MPIQEKDLGKYIRPGIYVEETDNSVVDTPAQNVLINLIPGFSKKGPYNDPIYIDNKVDFESIFGTIDYQLERKGSYFHRTCLKMIETGPIWALNLLRTESDRDKLSYVSISTTPKYANTSFTTPNTADYERFFNRQDFWKRDEDSFLDVVNDVTDDTSRLLHLTNMGEKTITVFLFKSDVTNFDVTAEDWYGSTAKVPQYISPKSLISDYLVDVLILDGDWTDYKTLSVDSTWSTYFTENGLIIDNITSFVNESAVDVLGNYDASLIPNFKDLDNRDMYIENLINNDTDKTRLFCTYNDDLLLDSDYPTDLADMVGDTVVGANIDTIDFLSYNQTIRENKEYPNVELDSANNVFAPNISGYGTNYGSTYMNWSTKNISVAAVTPYDAVNNTYSFDTTQGSYIINGETYNLSETKYTIQLNSVEEGMKRKDIIYFDTDGFQTQVGAEVDMTGSSVSSSINFNNKNTITLGTIEITNDSGNYTYVYDGISVDDSGFIELPMTITNGGDYISFSFDNTLGSTISLTEYNRLRASKYYDEVSVNLEANKGVIVNSTGDGKCEIIDPSSIAYTSLTDAQIKIYVEDPSIYMTGAIYYIDKEFIYTSGIEMSTKYDSKVNVVAKYSDFYVDYFNGEINNGDVINSNENFSLEMYVNDDVLTVLFEQTPTSPIIITTDIGNWRQTLEIEKTGSDDETNTLAIYVNKERYAEVTRGDYLTAYYDENNIEIGEQPRTLTRITNIKNDATDTSLKILYTDAAIKINEIGITGEKYTTVYPAIHEYATHLKGAKLTPFKLHTDSIPNGKEGRMEDILDVMGIGTQMYKGLTNKNKITWRYLVDSFGLGLSESSKQQYVDLCGEKLNCLGFINMPSAKSLKKSDNPSFTDDDGALNSEYIMSGGNEDKNPDFLYSFGTGDGRSTVGYFFPYVKSTVDGISKEVPPAAFVASAYMRKQLSSVGGTYPWTIVAGVNNGRISDIGGTEMDFTNDDLTNFASMGANPITSIKNVGYIINDESTAQVFPVSSLSYMHSREVLIELENELYDMLLRYQWKFNTPTIRAEIKYRADKICQRYAENGALYAYRNACDTTNNTNYIIDIQGGVLDTYVEIVKGMKFIVNNITIEKTGAINSTGFTE